MTNNLIKIDEWHHAIHRPALKSSGGDGTFGDMDARVSQLEKNFDRLDGKLSKLSDDIGAFHRTSEVRLMSIDTQLKTVATAADLGEIKGQLKALPTTIQLLGFVITIFLFAGFAKYFIR